MTHKWNWQHKDWPNFSYDSACLKAKEDEFLLKSGEFLGSFKHIEDNEKLILTIEMMSDEALNTSEIEGEYLDRDSVQSSIRRQMGLATDGRKVKPSESGIAEMIIQIYKGFAEPLTHEMLFAWHKMVTKGRSDIELGAYRNHVEPMQIVSGRLDEPTIHFEAPPSEQIYKEMDRFINWFNDTSPSGRTPLPALTRSSVAHIYFESIHPFEDGNGRIGRAIVEKSLAQSLGKASMIALSLTINATKKEYYSMLENESKTLTIDKWISYFAGIILKAQNAGIDLVEFIISKAKFYDEFVKHFNERQLKAISRIFREGPNGFLGGLSAEKYISITGASRATTTRDLVELVELGAFEKTGIGKGTRYYIK